MTFPAETNKEAPSSSRFWLISLSLLIVLGTIERIYGIDRQSLWSDELYAVMASYKHHFSHVWPLLINDSHPPGYVTLMYYTLPWIGYTDTGIRVLSLIHGILWIPLVYWLGSRWFSKSTGLIAAAIIASSYSAIYFSQEARAYSMLVVFNLLNIFCLFELLFANVPTRKHRIGFIAASSIMLYLHYTCFVFFMAEIPLYLVIRLLQRKAWFKEMALGFGIPLLLYCPWLGIMYHHLIDTSHDWGVSAKPTVAEVFNVFERLFGPDHRIMLAYCSGMVAVILLTVYDQTKNGTSRKSIIIYSLLYLLVLPVLAFYVESLVWTPIFEKRYFLMAVPIVALLIARTIVLLLNYLIATQWRHCFLFLLVVAISFLTVSSNIDKGLYSELNKDPVREAVNVIRNDLGNKATSNEYTVLMNFNWFEHYLIQEHVVYDPGWEFRHYYVPQQIGHIKNYLSHKPSINYFYYLSLRQSNAEGAVFALKQEYKLLSKAAISVPTGSIDIFKFSTKELPDSTQMNASGTDATNEAAKLIAEDVKQENPETYTALMTHDWMEAYLLRNKVHVDVSWPGRMFYLDRHIANVMDYLKVHPSIKTLYYMALRDAKTEPAVETLQLQYSLDSQQTADTPVGKIDIYKFNTLTPPTISRELTEQVKNYPLNQSALLVSKSVQGIKPRDYRILLSDLSFIPYLRLNGMQVTDKTPDYLYYSDLQTEHFISYLATHPEVQKLIYLSFHDSNTESAAAILASRYQLVSRQSLDGAFGKIDVYAFDTHKAPANLDQVKAQLARNPISQLAAWVASDTKRATGTYAVLLTHDWFQTHLEIQGVRIDRSWDGRFVSYPSQAENIDHYLKKHADIHTVYYVALITADSNATAKVLEKNIHLICQKTIDAPVGHLAVMKFDTQKLPDPAKTIPSCPE